MSLLHSKKASMGGVKPWYKSQTIQFFALVLAGGGIDLVMGFVQGEISARAFVIMLLGLVGIGLRLNTTQALK
jgi:hypothetical protein